MAGLNVSKWQASKRGWNYSPVLQFAKRMIETAMIEALAVGRAECPYSDPLWIVPPCDLRLHAMHVAGDRWDEAVMARDWIRRAAPDPRIDREGYLLSFDHCCEVLGLEPDHERLWMLAKIDAAADFDTDEVWARIDHLTTHPPDESEEPLFDAPRVVPELDQGCLFAMEAA